MPLPFQRLPTVAMRKVVENFDMDQIYRLTSFSQKTNELVQRSYEKPPIKIKVHCIANTCEFIIDGLEPVGEEEGDEDIVLWVRFDPEVQIFYKNMSIMADSCETVQTALRDAFVYLWNKYDVRAISFDVTNPIVLYMMRNAFDRGANVTNLLWTVPDCAPWIATYVLELFRNTPVVDFMIESDDFDFRGFSTFTCDILRIRRSGWVTLQNVCDMKHIKTLHMYGSNLSKNQLKWILNEWKTGQLNFKTLYLETQNEFDHNAMIAELKQEWGSLHIQLANGKKASVDIRPKKVCASVEKVWVPCGSGRRRLTLE